MDQIVVTILSTLVMVLFSVNLAFSTRHYRRVKHRRDRRVSSLPAALRGVVKSMIIEVGVLSIFVGRVLFHALPPDVDLRRYVQAINVAVVSGALLVGGLFLVLSWIFDHGGDEGPHHE